MSVQAAVFWTGLQAMIASAIDGRNIERNGTVLQLSTLVTPLVFPCADGEVVLIATGATLVGLVSWMVESGAVTREWADAEDWETYESRLLTTDLLVHSHADVRQAVTAFTLRHGKDELFQGGLARGVTLAPVNTAADVLRLEQLAVREYWDEVRLPSGRTLRAPGPFVKATRTPIAWGDRAPEIGEHTREVLAALADAGDQTAAATRAVPRSRDRGRARLPLEGVKVADFSWIGVGRSRPRRSRITERPSCTSRATDPPTACVSSARSRTTSQGSTAVSSSRRSTRPSCRCS
jgi:crotonobetainyl-CoA:carnitine CoA-transferase CaiB-like acyl-CoA transferase